MQAVFPLRLRNPCLRDLVREVAARKQISQNKLIEQVVAHEVLLRGATLIADLETAAERLAELTDGEYAKIIERSVTEFAEGEGRLEPLRAHMLTAEDL